MPNWAQLNDSLNIKSHLHLVKTICQDTYSFQQAKKLINDAGIARDLNKDEPDYHDKLLPPLVQWFADRFFKWFETPACDNCSNDLSQFESYINRENKSVEVYKCDRDSCDYKYEFIRHNEPMILLTTRQGRCGEWANCFFVFLKALDFDARIVFDSTDHCWNEVWSSTKGRWLHVDPCEQIIDKPLLYEIGWSKKLEYCIAYSLYDVLDVTRRYTRNYDQIKTRRAVCDDEILYDYLQAISEKLLDNIESDDDRIRMIERRLIDLDHLENMAYNLTATPDSSEFGGRKTGSYQWRIARGEYLPSAENHFIIKLSKPDVEVESFFLKYNCDKNSYTSSLQEFYQKNWSSLVYRYLNLDYKYERDWRTSYVARYESCPCNEVGEVEWRFDLSKLEGGWNSLEVTLSAQIYPSTSIELILTCFDIENCNEPLQTPLELKVNHLNKILKSELHSRTKIFALRAKLLGGEEGDNVGWQKPQLFRQTRGRNSEESMFIFQLRF